MRARVLGLLCLLGAAAAHADETAFWSKVAHPHRERYLDLLGKGKAMLDHGDPVNALPVLREAVSLEPHEPIGLWLLGSAYAGQTRWSDCADAVDRLVKEHPDYVPPDARQVDPLETQLGICLSLGGRVDEAIPHYQRVLAGKVTGTQRGMLHWNLGDCYMVLGRLDEAIEQYALSLPDRPQDSMVRFALGVAYDRDEQVARSRESIAAALVLDPEGARIADPNVLYLPPQDVFYYHGLANHVASTSEGTGADPLRRAAAIAFFRRYLVALPDGAWVGRAREHLAELGPAAMQKADVVTSAEEPDRAALMKGILAVGPDLQKCLEGTPNVVVRAVVVPAYAKLKPTVAPPPPAPPAGTPGHAKPNPYRAAPAARVEYTLRPGFAVTFGGPDEATPAVKACVEDKLRSLKLSSQFATKVALSFTGR